MGVMKSSLVRLLPFGAMVVVQCLGVGLTTLSKAAMSRGMNHFVFVVYSNALATLILLPTSFIFQRKRRPPLTFSLLCKFFLLSLVGITLLQNCVFTGISYSSPTLASALGNLIPAFTFLLAVLFRMEKLDLRSSISQIKILGTLVSVAGGLIITFYKGPPMIIAAAIHSPSLSSTKLLLALPSPSNMLTAANNWVIGGIFMATASVSAAVWNISQAAILKGYPSEITIVSFYCLFGTIQSAVVALIAERDPNAWKLRPDIELVAIFYSAVFGSVLTYSVNTWCIHKKGPVFVAMFSPFGIAIAALMGVIFLGDILHVGIVVGAVIIAAGFFGMIWSQSKEEGEAEKGGIDHRLPSSSQKTPLLHSPQRCINHCSSVQFSQCKEVHHV